MHLKKVWIFTLRQETSSFVSILVFTCSWNFMLSWVEHEKSFITLGPDLGPNSLKGYQHTAEVASSKEELLVKTHWITFLDQDAVFYCVNRILKKLCRVSLFGWIRYTDPEPVECFELLSLITWRPNTLPFFLCKLSPHCVEEVWYWCRP